MAESPVTAEPVAAVGARTVLPVAALVLGAIAMGISPIFVRVADVGPFASAFWRVGGALPVLAVWALLEARHAGRPASSVLRIDGVVVLAGLFFAGDLFFWHLAIMNTTVANATFLATMMPVWVVLGSALFLKERVAGAVVLGLLFCLAGAAALVGTSIGFAPDRLDGDLYGIATSFFFGAYVLAVRRLRGKHGAAAITLMSTLVTSLVLLVVALALEDRILPSSLSGWAAIAALAFVSHAGGQGLLAYALGHLPAAFSSLVIFLEALAAALFGWLFLSEPVTAAQAVGGALILLGIYVARPKRAR